MLAAKTFCRKKTFKEVYIDLIKKVQRRFTKRLRALKDLSYTERLLRLNILSLELRRLQLDLIFCHKFVFGRSVPILMFSSHLALHLRPRDTHTNCINLEMYTCASSQLFRRKSR